MRRPGNRAGAAAALGLAAAWALAAGSALAERTDLEKPVNIESDSMIADEAKKIATFEGKVVLTQGSLIIRADRIVARQDSHGFYNDVATGNPATFRHQLDRSGDDIDHRA